MNHTKKTDKAVSRRDALKALAAATGALTITSLPGQWETPLVVAGTLPAHAAISGTYVYFKIFFTTPTSGIGPAAMRVTVDAATGIATVEAMLGFFSKSPVIELNIDGTPSNAFTGTTCPMGNLPQHTSWSVVGYTLGDSSIDIFSSKNSWTVTVPLGTGTLPGFRCP